MVDEQEPSCADSIRDFTSEERSWVEKRVSLDRSVGTSREHISPAGAVSVAGLTGVQMRPGGGAACSPLPCLVLSRTSLAPASTGQLGSKGQPC